MSAIVIPAKAGIPGSRPPARDRAQAPSVCRGPGTLDGPRASFVGVPAREAVGRSTAESLHPRQLNFTSGVFVFSSSMVKVCIG